jgi:hypothetical protein
MAESHTARNILFAGAGFAGIVWGLGECTDIINFGESEEGRGTRSELVLPASELETSMGFIAVQNDIELRVTHDLEIAGRTVDLYTDVFPAQIPGFVEFKIEDMPEITVVEGGDPNSASDDEVTVQLSREDIFLQERTEQLQDSVSFTVRDGRLTEGEGLPIELGTRVMLEDGTYETGVFDFDPEQAESIITKVADAFTFGLTDINAGTTENLSRLGQLATLNPACIRAVDESVGLDKLIGTSFEDVLVRNGYQAEDITVEFDGKYPEYDEFPDETGTTFNEYTEIVEAALEGDNQKTIDFSADCDADGVVETGSKVTISSAGPDTTE